MAVQPGPNRVRMLLWKRLWLKPSEEQLIQHSNVQPCIVWICKRSRLELEKHHRTPEKALRLRQKKQQALI